MNKTSGCSCIFAEDGETLEKICDAHALWKYKGCVDIARLIDRTADFLGTDEELKSIACIEAALNHADFLRADNCDLRRKDGLLQTAEARLHEVYEIYAGMEGFIPETAPEGYCLMIIKKMAAVAKGGVE